jgi:hypothetical protein
LKGQARFATDANCLAVLEGPSGCGKHLALRLLAKSRVLTVSLVSLASLGEKLLKVQHVNEVFSNDPNLLVVLEDVVGLFSRLAAERIQGLLAEFGELNSLVVLLDPSNLPLPSFWYNAKHFTLLLCQLIRSLK